MIRHVSLDFWNTTASPNPEFAKARNAFLAGFFGMTEEDIKVSYTTVKNILDARAESTGVQGSVIEAYFELFRGVGFKGLREHAEFLNSEVSELFLKYPPIFPEGLWEEIKELKKRNIGLNITSNTNFISGTVIEQCIQPVFDFTLFSDLIGVSKPNYKIFEEVLILSKVDPKQILHVGDNTNADIKGADAAGFKTQYVKSPRETVNCLIYV